MVSHLTRPMTRTWPPSGLKSLKIYMWNVNGTAEVEAICAIVADSISLILFDLSTKSGRF